MTEDKSALLGLLGLLETLCSAEEGQRLRMLLVSGLQLLIEAEAGARIGAGRRERSETRTAQRNGTRERVVATTAGECDGADPEDSDGVVPAGVAGAAAAG